MTVHIKTEYPTAYHNFARIQLTNKIVALLLSVAHIIYSVPAFSIIGLLNIN